MAKIWFLRPGQVAILLLAILHLSECVEFHRGTTGVVFSAYIKRNENGNIPWWKTYTLEDVKTMLKVISSKFTRVITFGVGADDVPYIKGVTIITSNAQVMSAEAAALINLEKRQKNLTLIVGMWLSDKDQQTNTEVQLALETAEFANSIFNGTVEGFLFAHWDIQDNLARAKEVLKQIQAMRVLTNLRIGSRQQCRGISNLATDDLGIIRKEIIILSDFIMCDTGPEDRSSGAEVGFGTVHSALMRYRTEITSINPRIEVIGETSWAWSGNNPWETKENMEKYWRVVDSFGVDQNFTMFMSDAIDTPWNSPSGLHNGWWRLKKNSLVSRVDGYVENISDADDAETDADDANKKGNKKGDAASGVGIWIYVGLAVGVLILIGIFSAVGLLYFRVLKIQDALTSEDVKEFMYGLSDDAAAQQGGDAVSALKFPYDKSYEISKEKLNIKMNTLLGSGQFGCVYQALIEDKDDQQLEVALKMTKNNCPKTALVGILSEIKILTYLGKHPNIVSIQGAYTAEISKGIVYVATELCPNGSLEGYLRKCPFQGNDVRYSNNPTTPAQATYDNVSAIEITYSDMVRWSHEIACGMEYLGVKHIVHADLATRNILLTADKTTKITDFGLSRRLYDYTNYVKKQQEPLPWRWMAIESLKRLEFSEKSDVWSYGVTMWEIFALGDLPYPGLSWNLEFVDSLVSGLRMKAPPHATPEAYEIMVNCWNVDPVGRPSFNYLKLSTGHLLESGRG